MEEFAPFFRAGRRDAGRNGGDPTQAGGQLVIMVLRERNAEVHGFTHLPEIVRQPSENAALQVLLHALQSLFVFAMPAVHDNLDLVGRKARRGNGRKLTVQAPECGDVCFCDQ